MSKPVDPVPERLHTVTPRLVFAHEGKVAIEFYKEAFGAQSIGDAFLDPDDKVIHAEIRIGDSVVFITDEGDENGAAPSSVGGKVTAVMALNVPDVDAVWERALAAGCEVVYALDNHFYGDRGGRVRDPFGHQWMLSTHIEDVDAEEMERRMQEMMGRTEG
ncbi:MAG TPA: VOC family protein [Acidimicrobiales bacterium]|nr:VOC family protein [Acidimicrobiales bacterium]